MYPHFGILIALFARNSAFLLFSECPAPPPCSCSSSSGSQLIIHCDFQRLTAIPKFRVVSISLDNLVIYLHSNRLTSIPNNAFRNLSSIIAPNIAVVLSNNRQLNTIENNAFLGLENLTELHLNQNNFTTIPFAVSTLKRLKSLALQGSPLKSLDQTVLSRIGHSLILFEFDVALFTEWPAELRYLTTLRTFGAYRIPFTYLDAYAFHGFENTLSTLTMEYAKLDKIPHAICQLPQLVYFTFNYDLNLNENKSAIFEPCGHNLQKVTYLNLKNNSLRIFPDEFLLFPSLTSLYASYNRFEYIESWKIPTDSHLTDIQLTNNLFERIPPALNKLKFLTQVVLSYNKIKTVEICDLDSLSELRILSLNNNPLVYISPGAFSNNPALTGLDLRNTQLDHVPEDVIHLINLSFFQISGRPIDCTCDMSYLKNWNVAAVTSFDATCASSTEKIKSFVMTFLQSCQ